MKPKGIICGTGRAGTFLHFGAHIAAGAEIIAFVDNNEENARLASYKYNVKKFYTSIQEALKNERDIDFVDICTPSSSHFQIAKVALENNCHVLIEKPITNTLEELNELEKYRNKYKKIICAVHNHKFYPSMVKVRKLIKAGDLGDIISIHREMTFNYENVRMMEEDHWSHQIPGGRLFEANPHNLYLLYSMIGEFELIDIFPRKTYNHWSHSKLDEFQAVFNSQKTTISLKMSMHSLRKSYGKHGPVFFVIIGTKKTIVVNNSDLIDLSSPNNNIFTNLYRKLSRKAAKSKNDYKVKDRNGQICNIGLGSGHRWVIERFIGYIQGHYENEPVPFEEAMFTQRLNEKMGRIVQQKINA